ncbi:MAG TPA: hypothetical protein VMQ44_03560 [Candidatus Saccharimonadales bacterium]|nr:hypothetical protein [Candidatus Saccharimonadales bacterium]
MTVERLGDFLGSSYKKNFLGRVFSAGQLEKAIEKEYQDRVRVILKDEQIILVCDNPSQAKFYQLRRRKLYVLISQTFGSTKGFQLKIRVG